MDLKNNRDFTKDHKSTFERIKKVDEDEIEYWLERDFQVALGYRDWCKFLNVIEKAKQSCENSDHAILDHFVHMDKMVKIGSNTERQISDIKLSRYACYLIIQNADPSKEIIALGQTYFDDIIPQGEVAKYEQISFCNTQR